MEWDVPLNTGQFYRIFPCPSNRAKVDHKRSYGGIEKRPDMHYWLLFPYWNGIFSLGPFSVFGSTSPASKWS